MQWMNQDPEEMKATPGNANSFHSCRCLVSKNRGNLDESAANSEGEALTVRRKRPPG